MLSRRGTAMSRHTSPRGQVLVLFVLFLLSLLGVSALAVDYASWLLVDRNLQNVADHAALAGASAFDDRTSQGSCSGGLGQARCINARAQAWTSLNFGVVWVRVDRDVRSFVGGALGIQPDHRTGWATAGALPTEFALEVFCR